jgi:hypothetical protein
MKHLYRLQPDLADWREREREYNSIFVTFLVFLPGFTLSPGSLPEVQIYISSETRFEPATCRLTVLRSTTLSMIVFQLEPEAEVWVVISNHLGNPSPPPPLSTSYPEAWSRPMD